MYFGELELIFRSIENHAVLLRQARSLEVWAKVTSSIRQQQDDGKHGRGITQSK